MKKTKLFTGLVLLLLMFSISCKKEEAKLTAAQTLASTAWETTGARNEAGQSIALTDTNVRGFVGYAYFKEDGQFTIFSLQDMPRIRGDWFVPPNGKTRTLIVRNNNNSIRFARTFEITVLTDLNLLIDIFQRPEIGVSILILSTPRPITRSLLALHLLIR